MPREEFITSFDGNKIRVYIPDERVKENGVIVIHEIWGLEEHIMDVAGRFVREGYFSIAPQLYSRNEDILKPKNIESIMVRVWSIPPEQRGDLEALKRVEEGLDDVGKKIFDLLVKNRAKFEEQMVKDLVKVYDYLVSLGVKRIAAIGFCMGGGLAFQLATEVPLDGVIVFYGRNPRPIEAVSKIKGPILGIYAGEDPPINSGLPELISAIVKYKKDFEMKIYPNAYHAFFNDTRPAYNREAALDAWERVKMFLRRVFK